MAVNAFETAWSLVKEYNPNWRYQARTLPKLGNDDLMQISQQWLEDTGQLEPDYVGFKDFPSGQTMEFVLPHPNNPNFMVKVPRSSYSEMTGRPKWQYGEETFDSYGRFGDEYYGKNLVQMLEDLGFPVVSEHNENDRYLIQPALNAHEPDTGRGRNGRPRLGIADVALEHIIPDRVDGNWGVDQTGNWRMFDVDMGLNEPADYMPTGGLTLGSASHYHPEKLGEKLQQGLDKFGMQLPASRLLNFMSNIDHDRDNMRTYLEALEPHSDNPNYLTIEGKPVWREGY